MHKAQGLQQPNQHVKSPVGQNTQPQQVPSNHIPSTKDTAGTGQQQQQQQAQPPASNVVGQGAGKLDPSVGHNQPAGDNQKPAHDGQANTVTHKS